MTDKEMLKSPGFWIALISIFLGSLISTGAIPAGSETSKLLAAIQTALAWFSFKAGYSEGLKTPVPIEGTGEKKVA